ncbi:MAG: prepilin-type N-terminal cleavage/methylation domain-containing protein [Lachnospirales bacterium]
MKKKGLTLIEIIAAVAILGIIAVLAFTYMGKQNNTIKNIAIIDSSYRNLDEDLKKAIEEDVDNTDGIYTRLEGNPADTSVSVVKNSATINGKTIDYELFYKTEDLIIDSTVSNFSYNFEVIEDANATDKLLYPADLFMLQTEPFNYTNASNEITHGLIDRMEVTNVPFLDYPYIDKLLSNSNYVTVNLATNGSTLSTSTFTTAINKLKTQIDNDTTGTKKDQWQVIYLKSPTQGAPVYFPNTNNETTRKIDLHFQSLNNNDKPTSLIIVTDGTFGTANSNSFYNTYGTVFNISGGDVYMISTGSLMYMVTNFRAEANMTFYNSSTQRMPQFNMANTLSNTYAQKTIVGCDESSISVFLYYPYMQLTVSNSDIRSSTARNKIVGGIIAKNGVTLSGISSTYDEWLGDYRIYGYE